MADYGGSGASPPLKMRIVRLFVYLYASRTTPDPWGPRRVSWSVLQLEIESRVQLPGGAVLEDGQSTDEGLGQVLYFIVGMQPIDVFL